MKIWPMFCKACGQGIDRGDKFCRNCGVPLPQEPIESAVAATASAAATGEPPIAVASSTAELQRPLPIPKALLTERASAAAGEEKPSALVTSAAIPDAAPPTADAGKTASSGAQSMASEQKPEVADAAAQTPTESKSGVVEAATQKPSEPKPEATDTSAPPALQKQVPSAAGPAQPAVPEPPAQAVSASAARLQETSKPEDSSRAAESRPVRLCPQCHRLVGDDDLICERCKAKLDQPASPQPAAVSEQHYGVPSFAGYAAETPARKDAEKTSDRVATSDPSGVDAIANLRVRKRRGLSVVEIVVAVILLAGAAMAVWMLRTSLPSKNSTAALVVEITISPARAKVLAGHGCDFAATVSGTDNYNVDWSIDEGDAGGRIVPRGAKANSGAVSSLAVYMAPKTPGTYHLTATSKADSAKSASATITVTGK